MTRHAFLPRAICIALTALLLSGCALPDTDFPSLKRRPIEDMPVDDQPVAKQGKAQKAIAMPANLRGEVDTLLQDARAADSDFRSGLAKAQTAVAAGQDAGKNSESWVVAQTEVSALSTHHNRTVNLLSAIDTLFIRETERQYERDMPYDLTLLMNAQSEVQDIVARQRTEIAALDNRLR
ncbi:MAG: hypothetical protein AAFX04_10880 [Pseudomonadota bacterium]